MTKLTQPSEIRNHLAKSKLELPGSWDPYVTIAGAKGLTLVPVQWVDSTEVDIGDSPGGSWAWGEEVFIAIGEDPECTVLHEVCHYVVALQQDKAGFVNFNSSVDDEITSCDAQITWVLANQGAKEAYDVAMFLQYSQASSTDTIRRTVEQGCDTWKRAGMPQSVSEKLIQKLAQHIDPCWTADRSWAGPINLA